MKYKLYKAGKFIVTAGVILGTALTFSQVSASANTEKLPSEGVTMQTPNSTAVAEITVNSAVSFATDQPESSSSKAEVANTMNNSAVSSPSASIVSSDTSASENEGVNNTNSAASVAQNQSSVAATDATVSSVSEPASEASVSAEKSFSEAKNGWVDGKYYINDAAANGFLTVDNKLYKFIDGIKQTGWQTRLNQNDWYYFGADGTALAGLQQLDGGYKYFDTTYIQAKNAWRTTGSNKWYYFYSYDGKAVIGLQQLDGGYKYFDGDGIQAKDTWRTTGENRWYYLNAYDGKAVTGLQQLDGGYKYFDNDGIQAKNAWRTTGWNNWYFLNSYDGKAVTGLQTMDGGHKYFDNNGVQVKNAWRTTGWNNWYFLNAYDGKAVTGLQLLEGKVKYFDDNGIQVKNKWRNISGRSIHMNSYDGVVDSTTLAHTWYSQLNQGAPEGCEATALHIALSVKGRWASPQDIYNRTGYGFWGNPDANFYGNPWGGGVWTTQTVTARRLAEATKSIYSGIDNLVSASVADIEREIALGNAVVTWGDYTWQLNKAFHVMTIVGMNADSFLISDPYATSKKEYWISKGTWAYINGNESANGWNLPKMMNVVVR
ncbi:hypothetical protein HAU47_03840 [Weissella confusa]|uniref:C39 family peptidase n=1 Tax=Weissella confusa TaxID=1583 RepID=UPI001080247E|nr:C39 family peptidase [Weissella confusa]MBJ7619730.1 hypothetical protein [Weissella confusa]MBJ7667065.1 hypothetical protein [Weissella confusa]TGE58500.1 hypothetical protein C6P21_07065 [Weissella confusa]